MDQWMENSAQTAEEEFAKLLYLLANQKQTLTRHKQMKFYDWDLAVTGRCKPNFKFIQDSFQRGFDVAKSGKYTIVRCSNSEKPGCYVLIRRRVSNSNTKPTCGLLLPASQRSEANLSGYRGREHEGTFGLRANKIPF